MNAVRYNGGNTVSVQLLDKTRKINKLLHNNSSSKVVFNDICEVLTEILNSNILVISKKGKVLGISHCEGVEEIQELIADSVGGHIDEALNERLLSILSTKENVNLQTLGFVSENVNDYQAIITAHRYRGRASGNSVPVQVQRTVRHRRYHPERIRHHGGRPGDDAFCRTKRTKKKSGRCRL